MLVWEIASGEVPWQAKRRRDVESGALYECCQCCPCNAAHGSAHRKTHIAPHTPTSAVVAGLSASRHFPLPKPHAEMDDTLASARVLLRECLRERGAQRPSFEQIVAFLVCASQVGVYVLWNAVGQHDVAALAG